MADLELAPVSRRSVGEAVYQQLAAQILDGRLAAGSPLPAERALTEALGVNRQAVREALKRLAQSGLIDTRHGAVTRVLDFRRTAGLDLLPQLLLRPDGRPDVAVVRSVMELRAALGPEIAGRCARRAPPTQAGAVSQAVDALAEADRSDPVVLAPLDVAFWQRLVEGSDNIAYQLAFNSLRRVYEPLIPVLAPVLATEIGDLQDHRIIADAVLDSDPSAAEDAAWALLARGTAAMAEFLTSATVRAEHP